MKRLAVIAAVFIAIAAGVAYSVTRGHGVSAAAQRQHYYTLGRRQCAQAIKSAYAQTGNQPTTSGQSSVIFGFGISTKGVPKQFRAALSAGCQSAQ